MPGLPACVTYESWLGYPIRRAFLMCHLAGAHCGAMGGKGAPAHVIYVQLHSPQLHCLCIGFCHFPSGVSFTEGCGFSISHVPGRLWTERNGQCEAWRSGNISQVGSSELLNIRNGHLQKADEWSLPVERLPGGPESLLWVSVNKRCLPHEPFPFIPTLEFIQVYRMKCPILDCYLSQFTPLSQ